jgi:hypothetical protein
MSGVEKKIAVVAGLLYFQPILAIDAPEKSTVATLKKEGLLSWKRRGVSQPREPRGSSSQIRKLSTLRPRCAHT